MISEHAALAKEKLADGPHHGRELERMEELLGSGETVVTMAQALFRSRTAECRGLAVLTDRRLLCVDMGSDHSETIELSLAGITSLETSISGGSGDARRGEMSISSPGSYTQVLRIYPWERAEEIAAYVAAPRD